MGGASWEQLEKLQGFVDRDAFLAFDGVNMPACASFSGRAAPLVCPRIAVP